MRRRAAGRLRREPFPTSRYGAAAAGNIAGRLAAARVNNDPLAAARYPFPSQPHIYTGADAEPGCGHSHSYPSPCLQRSAHARQAG